jgi:uncharacterized integral membrane protein
MATTPDTPHPRAHEPEPVSADPSATNVASGAAPTPSTASGPHPPDTTDTGTPAIERTRTGGTWVAVIVAAVVLIFLLIFILQNMTTVTVEFLGLSGSLPLGVAMLFAAIAGAILVALVGTARILQLRRLAKRVGTSQPA